MLMCYYACKIAFLVLSVSYIFSVESFYKIPEIYFSTPNVMHNDDTRSLFQEYEVDGVDWTKVDFEDNQDCLDLIEKVFLFSM